MDRRGGLYDDGESRQDADAPEPLNKNRTVK
jgi:hypothetical protein